MSGDGLSRRDFLAAAAALPAAAAPSTFDLRPSTRSSSTFDPRPSTLPQAVCRWPYANLPLPDLCRVARAAGITGLDLLHPDEWAVARDQGLAVVTGNSTRRRSFLTDGLCDPAMQATVLRELEAAIPLAADAGVPQVIALTGNRRGRSDSEGIAASAEALRRIAPLAEERGVTVVVEMLNSLVDHPDQFADRTALGVAIAEAVGSPRVRLLYDVYHMQVMEGNVIATLRRHLPHIAHVHTAGVPGRHELDARQELQYPAIAAALAEAGYAGWVAHEFVPTRDALAGLREAFSTFRPA
ncbi:MAG TPA: TIM barrel protein [Gemmatimonadales bacterium]|nr:TIM barrel protein [Gemmatimonadales bacterium]